MTRGWVTAIAEDRPIEPDFATGARVQELVAAAIASTDSERRLAGRAVPLTPTAR